MKDIEQRARDAVQDIFEGWIFGDNFAGRTPADDAEIFLEQLAKRGGKIVWEQQP